MKYKVLFCLTIILLSGCSASYNIKINKNLSVEGNIKINGDSNFQVPTDYTEETYFNAMAKLYSKFYKQEDYNNIKRSSNDDNSINVSLDKKDDDLISFAESHYVKILYPDGLNITEYKNNVTISSKTFVDNLWIFIEEMDSVPIINNLKINITLPYNVINHNADYVDTKTNTYTWMYNFSSYRKSLEITFNKKDMFESNEINIKTILIISLIAFVITLAIINIRKYLINKNVSNNRI